MQALPYLWYGQSGTVHFLWALRFSPVSIISALLRTSIRRQAGNFKAVLLRSFRSEGRTSTFLGVKTIIERYGQCMCWCSNVSSRLNSMKTKCNLCVQCTVCVTLYILPLLRGGMLRVVTWISYDECLSQTSCEPLHCTHRLHTCNVGRTVLTHEEILNV